MQIKKIVICLGVFSLAACSTWNANKNINQVSADVQKEQQNMDNVKSIAANNYITEINTGMFTAHASKLKDTEPLPAVFYDTFQIDKTFTSLRDAADALTQLTGIPSDVDSSTLQSTNNEDRFKRVTQQNGNLINLLNAIATKYDVAWSYHEGTIEFNQFDTRTWIINGIPGDYQMQNNVTNLVGLQAQNQANTNGLTTSQGPTTAGGTPSGGSSGNSGSASQNNNSQSQSTLTFNTNASIWDSIQNSVKAMLTEKGKLNVAPADSTLTVTDRPHVIRQVDRYVYNENIILGRQVKLQVNVYSIQVNNSDNYGWNWQAVVNNSPVKINFTGTAGFTPATGSSAFTIAATSGNMTGSQAVVSALSKQYKTSVVTTASVITRNNQPAPVQAARQTSYLASSQTTQVAQAGAQTTLTPGVVTTGFQMNVLPEILPNGEINLQLTINISELIGMNTVTSNQSSLQLPDVETKSFMQKTTMRTGDTLVLSGFERNSNTITEQGVGSVSNWLFGGGEDASKNRNVILVFVTPEIIGSK
ncbi:MAG: PilN family type IVB pilus formation outer membrane protein [Neisseriaceae bacterium]|nr:MAG: PilN family type IVB pilus formation outer membrane protein [Neisseriaceae bacterium]